MEDVGLSGMGDLDLCFSIGDLDLFLLEDELFFDLESSLNLLGDLDLDLCFSLAGDLDLGLLDGDFDLDLRCLDEGLSGDFEAFLLDDDFDLSADLDLDLTPSL